MVKEKISVTIDAAGWVVIDTPIPLTVRGAAAEVTVLALLVAATWNFAPVSLSAVAAVA